MAARLAEADHRISARLSRRGGEDGFVLLETLVAIGLIILVMAAFNTFFVGAVTSTNHERATQTAVQLADSSMEQIRSLPISDLLTGHDTSSVAAQFNAAPASIASALLVMTQGVDPAATTGAGITAKIPTDTVSQTVNSIAYGVNDYLGSCVIPFTGSTACGVGLPTAGNSYLRALVSVTWRDQTCQDPINPCVYTTSTLLNQGAESCFYFFQTPPAALSVTDLPDPATRRWTVGDKRSLQLAATPSAGTGDFRWTLDAGQLPAGLALSPAGLISGSPTTIGTGSITVRVTDSCLRTATRTFTWEVVDRPTIATPPDQTSTVNVVIVPLPMVYTCPNTPCTFTIVNPPVGLTINATTGVISGRPTIPGTVTVTVTVTDKDGLFATTSPFTWSVLLPATVCVKSIALPNGSFEAPVRSAGADTNWLHGNGVTPGLLWNTTEPDNNIEYWHNGGNVQDANGGLPIAAEDGDQWAELNANGVGALYQDLITVPGQVLQWSVYHRARGVNGIQTGIDVMQVQIGSPTSQSAQVPTGQPTADISDGPLAWKRYTGVYTVPAGQTITRFQFAAISTSSGDQTVGNFIDDLSLNNNIACLVTPTTDQASTVGTAIPPFSVAVDRGTGPFVWGGGATLPAGLVLATNGQITGTPTTPGTKAVVLSFSDATAFAQTVSFNWTVYPAPTITTPTNQSHSVGSRVSLQLVSACLNAPCTYALNNGPPGLGISGSGVVTGTIIGPAQVFGAATVTITDASGATATTGAFTWTVLDGPTITTPPTQTATVNAPVRLTVTSTCPNLPCRYSLASAPSGLTINSSGVITGSPTSIGTSTVTATVTDVTGATATTDPFTWAVVGPPTVTTPPAQTTIAGAPLSLTVAYTCPNAPCTFALAKAPAGLTIDGSGVISGSPTTSGSFTGVTVTVTDVAGVSAVTTAFSWTVRVDSMGTLTNPVWSVSSPLTSATAATYAYTYTTATKANNLSSVTMTVPAGTSGTPVATISGFTASNSATKLAGNLLTVTFSAVNVPAGSGISINVAGMTNTSTVGTYFSQLTTYGGLDDGTAVAVDSATAGPIAFTKKVLTNAIWSVSNSTTASKSVTYSYGFTTATVAVVSSLTMTVPPGTSGSPTVSVTGLPAGTITLSGTVLTYTVGTAISVAAGTAISLSVSGITNTSFVGVYKTELVTSSSTGLVDSAFAGPVSFTAGTLSNAAWSVSRSVRGGTATTYSYGFSTTTAATVSSVSMSVPPGTAGTTLTVLATGLSAGTISLSGTVLTYTLTTPAPVPSGQAVSISVSGLTNTSLVGSYTSELVTYVTAGSATVPVDSAIAGPVSFTLGTLTVPTWSVSSTSASATGVTYKYTFTTATLGNLTSISMTVPPGTGGAPAVSAPSLPGATITLSGTLLTVLLPSAQSLPARTAVSITVTGLTNTSVVGSYTSQIVTAVGSTGVAVIPLDSALTAAAIVIA